MKLDSIRLQNYRCHADLTVNFQPGLNVVVGVNGSGKTSLLKGIGEVFYGLIVNMNVHHIDPISELGAVRLMKKTTTGRARFDPQYPVVLGAAGDAFNTPCVWQLTKTNEVGRAAISGQYPGQIWQTLQQMNRPPAQVPHTLPLLAFYRANRQWSQPAPNELQAATLRNARTDGYARWWDASLDGAALQSWVVAQCLRRFQTSSESGVLFDAILDDELALVNAALAVAVEGVKGLRYDLNQSSLLVEWQAGAHGPRDATAFENLSDGQRAVIGLVADIARRMCLLNPHLAMQVTQQTPGVVLIDELDMHLHPKWQRLITVGLQAAFPALQIIATSHSPQVLGELRPEQIILLGLEGTTRPERSKGLDSSEVLEELMGSAARNVGVTAALREIRHAIDDDALERAQDLLNALRLSVEDIPAVQEAQSAIDSLRWQADDTL